MRSYRYLVYFIPNVMVNQWVVAKGVLQISYDNYARAIALGAIDGHKAFV